MNTPKNLLDYSNYLFIFTHPDDEIYTCALISELIKTKTVNILYVTSGDNDNTERGLEREKELADSMTTIGVISENVHFLRVPERKIMIQALEAQDSMLEFASSLNPDCIITHDFEGGHNAHDFVSFLASNTAKKIDASLFVFPAYHGWPEKRQWNKFISNRIADFELSLNEDQKTLKNAVIASHKTQNKFMKLLTESNDFDLFISREILREITCPIDYSIAPEKPLGYEFPGSKIKFEEFLKTIINLKQ